MSTAPSNLGGGTDAALNPRMPALAPPVPAAKSVSPRIAVARALLDLADGLLRKGLAVSGNDSEAASLQGPSEIEIRVALAQVARLCAVLESQH